MTPYNIRIEIRKSGVRMRALTAQPVHVRYRNNAGNGVQVTGVTGQLKNQLEYLGEEIQDLLEQEVSSYSTYCKIDVVVGTTGAPAFFIPPPPTQDPPYPPPIWPPLPDTTPITGDEDIWIV